MFTDFCTRSPILEVIPLDLSTSEDFSYNKPFNASELQEALARCKYLSVGPDKISAKILKGITTASLDYLLSLINKSWLTGIVPEI